MSVTQYRKNLSELLAEWRRDTRWKALWEEDNKTLPFELWRRGCKFYVAWEPDHSGLYRKRAYFAAAVVKDWQVIKEWEFIPSLTELFELVSIVSV